MSFTLTNHNNTNGKWCSQFTKQQPLHIELGCGKGGFIAHLAFQNPNINYIAIDLIDTMLGLAKRKIEAVYQQKKVDNVLLARCDIERILTMLDTKDVVDRIYINFCNPWPRGKHKKKRLTHTKQLTLYKTFLKSDGEIHFRTDDDMLFQESLTYFKEAGFEIIAITYDLHENNIMENTILTEHENMFKEQGIKIKALIAKLK